MGASGVFVFGLIVVTVWFRLCAGGWMRFGRGTLRLCLGQYDTQDDCQKILLIFLYLFSPFFSFLTYIYPFSLNEGHECSCLLYTSPSPRDS